MNKRQRGTVGEDAAVDYLVKKGYRILERNFRFDRGEIDIVADDRGTLVFVEVKTRHSKSFGEPEDAVTPKKRLQLRKVAKGYLYAQHIESKQCRFDVVAIEYQGGDVTIRHIENAF